MYMSVKRIWAIWRMRYIKLKYYFYYYTLAYQKFLYKKNSHTVCRPVSGRKVVCSIYLTFKGCSMGEPFTICCQICLETYAKRIKVLLYCLTIGKNH